MLDWCRPTNRIAPAAAAQTYRMQAKQQEKLELEGILEQVLWHRASVYSSLSTKSPYQLWSRVWCMQMQEQQAELEASLQQKQLEVMQAADQFQPVITNLEKVCVMFTVQFMGYKLMSCVS